MPGFNLRYNAGVKDHSDHDSTVARLKARHSALWDAAQGHDFVEAIADGSLERSRFVFYLRQDYLYLQAYARAINIAAGRAPGLKLLSEFTALANETLNSEMQFHREYCAEFGLSDADLEQTVATPICQGYGDFCITTAVMDGCAGLLAALIPCGVGYAEIGLRLASRIDADNPYAGWVGTYAGEEFQQYGRWMAQVFDSLAADAGGSERERLSELFALGCRYEWLFWEMAWTEAKWPL